MNSGSHPPIGSSWYSFSGHDTSPQRALKTSGRFPQTKSALAALKFTNTRRWASSTTSIPRQTSCFLIQASTAMGDVPVAGACPHCGASLLHWHRHWKYVLWKLLSFSFFNIFWTGFSILYFLMRVSFCATCLNAGNGLRGSIPDGVSAEEAGDGIPTLASPSSASTKKKKKKEESGFIWIKIKIN